MDAWRAFVQLTPRRVLKRAVLCLCASLVAASVSGITLKVDYTLDSSGFFGNGNAAGPAAGAQAKAALEAAASYYSLILTDAFSAIQAPPNFTSTAGGTATFKWTIGIENPSLAGNLLSFDNQVLAADEYRIYAGARSLPGSTIGVGGFSTPGYETKISGAFNPGEGAAQSLKAQQFVDAVTKRGQASGFVTWGGTIAFDTDANANWHFNHTTAPTVNKNDFYSVALHELGHALGLGTSSQWKSLSTSAFFTGSAATSLMGGNPPLGPVDSANGTRGHWAEGTMSKVYGSNIPQEALLDPTITSGTRKRLTALDAAAMTDIGWSLTAPPPLSYLPADFNDDGLVNAADLTMWKGAFGVNANGDANGDNVTNGADFLVWQRQFGQTPAVAAASPAAQAVPEPSAGILSAIATMLLAAARRYAASSGRIFAAKPTH